MVPFEPLSAKASLPEMESAFMDWQVYYHSVYFTSHWPASGICCSTSVLRILKQSFKRVQRRKARVQYRANRPYFAVSPLLFALGSSPKCLTHFCSTIVGPSFLSPRNEGYHQAHLPIWRLPLSSSRLTLRRPSAVPSVSGPPEPRRRHLPPLRLPRWANPGREEQLLATSVALARRAVTANDQRVDTVRETKLNVLIRTTLIPRKLDEPSHERATDQRRAAGVHWRVSRSWMLSVSYLHWSRQRTISVPLVRPRSAASTIIVTQGQTLLLAVNFIQLSLNSTCRLGTRATQVRSAESAKHHPDLADSRLFCHGTLCHTSIDSGASLLVSAPPRFSLRRHRNSA
jgi:hypothetical protein